MRGVSGTVTPASTRVGIGSAMVYRCWCFMVWTFRNEERIVFALWRKLRESDVKVASRLPIPLRLDMFRSDEVLLGSMGSAEPESLWLSHPASGPTPAFSVILECSLGKPSASSSSPRPGCRERSTGLAELVKGVFALRRRKYGQTSPPYPNPQKPYESHQPPQQHDVNSPLPTDPNVQQEVPAGICCVET